MIFNFFVLTFQYCMHALKTLFMKCQRFVLYIENLIEGKEDDVDNCSVRL